MTRRQMIIGDIECSDSERENHERATPKRVGSRVRRYSTSSARRVRESSKDHERSWRSNLLKWNVLQTKNGEGNFLVTPEMTVGNTLPSRPSTGRLGSGLEKELPLSDPQSWVWQRDKGAKLAVAIDATKGIFPDLHQTRKLVSINVDLAEEKAYLAQGNLETKAWLDKVESMYPLCLLHLESPSDNDL